MADTARVDTLDVTLRKPSTRFRSWLPGFTTTYFAAAFLLALIFFPLWNELQFLQSTVGTFLCFGILAGLLAFSGIVFGLSGDSWVEGFFWGTIATVLLWQVALLGMSSIVGLPPQARITGFCVPGFLFAAAAPLLVARHFASWRLVRNELAVHIPSSLGTMCVSMILMASVLLAARASQVMWGLGPGLFWMNSAIFMLIVAVLSAPITLPTVRWIGVSSGGRFLGLLSILAVVISSVVFVFVWTIAFLFSASLPSDFIPATIATASGVTSALFIGLRAMHLDGFRLQTKATDNPVAAPDDLRRARRRINIYVGLILVSIVSLNVYVARVERQRQTLLAVGNELQTELNTVPRFKGPYSNNSDSYTPGSTLVGTYSSSLTDEGVARIVELVSEANLNRDFQRLRFSGDQLSDDCLADVGRLTNLKVLDIAYTGIKGHGFSHLRELRLRALSLSGLDLREADWSAINVDSLHELTVEGCKLDSEQLAMLLDRTCELKTSNYGVATHTQFPALNSLRLSDVEFTPRLMQSIAHVQTQGNLGILSLEGRDLTDEAIAGLAEKTISYLSLSGPNVTDQCIETILSIGPNQKLDLRRCGVTDHGVARLQEAIQGAFEYFTLDLSHTGINGDAFAGWSELPSNLDLANTNVDDDIIKKLSNTPKPLPRAIQRLSLANTAVTDNILKDMGRLHRVTQLDIRGTAITAKALLKAAPKNVQQWIVSDGQFTEKEEVSLNLAGVFLSVE